MKAIYTLSAILIGLGCAGAAGATPIPIPANDGHVAQATGAKQARPADLGTLQVTGERRKILKMIQIGLKTPISTDPAAREVVACQLKYRNGSHIKQIVCAMNKTWLGRQEATAVGWDVASSGAGAGGMTMAKLIDALNRRGSNQGFAIFNNSSKIMAQLKQLPPAKKDAVVRMMREIKDQ